MSMAVTCPSCEAKFDIDESLAPPGDFNLVCTQCEGVINIHNQLPIEKARQLTSNFLIRKPVRGHGISGIVFLMVFLTWSALSMFTKLNTPWGFISASYKGAAIKAAIWKGGGADCKQITYNTLERYSAKYEADNDFKVYQIGREALTELDPYRAECNGHPEFDVTITNLEITAAMYECITTPGDNSTKQKYEIMKEAMKLQDRYPDKKQIFEEKIDALMATPCLSGTGSLAKSPDFGWIVIPAGTFQMGCVPVDNGYFGDDKPRHSVTISRGFRMMKNLVTVAQFRTYILANSRTMPEQPAWSKDDHPVVNVNWNEAKSYCERAEGRLPTEAEWEYAARGGKDGTVYPWGNEASHDYANYGGIEGRDQWKQTSPVGSFPANEFGLFDMSGNVWEWVGDWYNSGYFQNSPATDPQGPGSGADRILRGGDWRADLTLLGTSRRAHSYTVSRSDGHGFRCVRD